MEGGRGEGWNGKRFTLVLDMPHIKATLMLLNHVDLT